MGNIDMASNQQLMASHNKFVLDFIQKPILFNVEDITFPLSTSGIRIVDATGKRVKIAGGNWSGGHLCRECVDGLQMRPMKDIAYDIRYKFKMNCVRLPYSLQLFFYNKIVETKYLKANPELIGKTALQIFDITVKTLTDVGLMVILNNHTSTSMWCCSNDDGDGLWWTYEFPQYKFFQSCQQFAKRYKDNPRVIGMDLRNELRKAHGVESTWGDGNPVTDWHRAAKICGEKVLKIAPDWLILVGGLNYQLDLTAVNKTPLEYSIKNKLVYTGHFYGFSWPVPSWALVSYDSFKKKMFNTQTFVRGLGHPYLLGQFGNNQRDVPWNYLIRYLKETDIDWTYWALDGFKCDPEQDETYGVFTNDFMNARHPDMLADMISVGPPQGTVVCQPPHKQQIVMKSEIKGIKPSSQQILDIKRVNSNREEAHKNEDQAQQKNKKKTEEQKAKIEVKLQVKQPFEKKKEVKTEQSKKQKKEEKKEEKKEDKKEQIKEDKKQIKAEQPTKQKILLKNEIINEVKDHQQIKLHSKDPIDGDKSKDSQTQKQKHKIFDQKYKNN